MKSISLCGLCVTLFCTSLLVAQEPPKPVAAQKEHDWLKQFVGEWETESEAEMGPGQPAMKCKGTMNARMLGGFWVISESKGEMLGNQVHALQTIGYDPKAKKYVGTWVDSMLNYLWKYDGSIDKSGKVLTLEAEGPHFTVEGKMGKYRDVYEFKSKDEIAMSSMMLGDDGKWVTFMTGKAKRKKSGAN